MELYNFIDKERTTISILRAWHDKHWKAEHGKEEIKSIDARLSSVSTSRVGRNVSGGTSDYNDALAAAIDKKELAAYGQSKAEEYIHELAPYWEQLTADEQYVLTARFVDHQEGNGIERIRHKYNIEKTEAYNRSNAALRRLAALIFW